MGGLVIKRAYILARQREEFHLLADRFSTMIFLATPHRGADIAQLLSKILNFSPGSRPFVTDLHRNSLATQSINDEFPQYCQGLQLYSFFETLPTSHGVGKSIIVDKDLSILGYANERTAYLNANHREVCKYSNQSDPNYHTVRNALAHAIDNFREHAADSRRRVDQEQQRLLDEHLGVSDRPEDDLMGVDAVRLEGSCEWLFQKEDFVQWRDSANTTLFWISAKPAMGKTVLSGSVIHHLRSLKRDLAFYFFDYRNKVKTTPHSILLSLAWQMAQMHMDMFTVILEIFSKDSTLAKSDARTLWRKLYLEGLLKVRLNRPQFWVIDALDECKAGSELVSMLLKVTESSPIRILLTSRDRFEVYRHIAQAPITKVVEEEIREADVKNDISLFLAAHKAHMPSIDDDARQEMVRTILEKSAGCFLWVRLVLNQLRRVHTAAEVNKVLEDIPLDMDELYSRILESMSAATYGKALAQGILTFTVCSLRPLQTEELYHALKIDLRDSIDNIERSIESSCGQLVYVDSKSQVQMIHKSGADFLLRSNNPDFAVNHKAGHKRVAQACLSYLNGPEMKGPRHRRLSSRDLVKQRSPFITYAACVFEHLQYISPFDEDMSAAIVRFLRSSNVLSFIEYLCQKSDLASLIRAGKALQNYLQQRAKHLAPLGKDFALMKSWATDLLRIATKFGKDLLAHPPAIYHLIPPFCPLQSAPRQQFASSTRGIAILGLPASTWDDCLTTIVNTSERFSSIACSPQFFAIGMLDGQIAIYDYSTCQEVQTLRHHEPVRLMQFAQRLDLFASTGPRKARIWCTSTWDCRWEFDIMQPCLAVALAEEQQLLLAALRDNRLMIWDLVTGTLRESADWTLSLDENNAHFYRRPIAGAFSLEYNLLAIAYRGQDILVWDLERDAHHDTYCKEGGAHTNEIERHSGVGASALMFNTGLNAHLMVATYVDGDLVLFDTLEGTIVAKTLANAHILGGSSDGRTLATADASGIIQIYDFESLRLLYRINSEEYGIKQMAFSRDGQRILAIRSNHCKIWDPTVLLRQDADDESSDAISVSSFSYQEPALPKSADSSLITASTCCKALNLFIYGKEDGTVWLYDVKWGQGNRQLFAHARGIAVLHLFFDESSRVVSSVDSSSRLLVYRLAQRQTSWEAGEKLLDHRVGAVVKQILSNSASSRLLVSTENRDILYNLVTDRDLTSQSSDLLWETRRPYRWTLHPLNADALILIEGNTAHLFSWLTLERLTSKEGILLEGSLMPELQIQAVIPCCGGELLSTSFEESSHKSKLLLWDSSDFAVGHEKAVPVPRYRFLASQVKKLIGEHGNRMIFLHTSNWICSANLQSAQAEDYDRHFFLPADWVGANADLQFGLTASGDILFVKRDQIAIIKRGLDNVELASRGLGNRPSLLGRPHSTLVVPGQTAL